MATDDKSDTDKPRTPWPELGREASSRRLAALPYMAIGEGSHSSFTEGHCALELVAWLAGEKHSDRPRCACLAVGPFVTVLNDWISDAAVRGALLLPLCPLLVGSRASLETTQRRTYVAVDWAARIAMPMALGKNPGADLLRALPEVTDEATAREARDLAGSLQEARDPYFRYWPERKEFDTNRWKYSHTENSYAGLIVSIKCALSYSADLEDRIWRSGAECALRMLAIGDPPATQP